MNKITPSPGMVPEATGGSPTTQAHMSAAGPHFDLCRQCLGEGTVSYYRTNDPDEREKHRDCPRCDGWGLEPETEEEEE